MSDEQFIKLVICRKKRPRFATFRSCGRVSWTDYPNPRGMFTRWSDARAVLAKYRKRGGDVTRELDVYGIQCEWKFVWV